MTTKILLTNVVTGQNKVMFASTEEHAEQIIIAMNKLNEEAAKITGRVIQFVYTTLKNEN